MFSIVERTISIYKSDIYKHKEILCGGRFGEKSSQN
jgi:hypothetical protein